LDDGLEGGESGILDRGGLVGEGLEESRERRRRGVGDDVRLEVRSGTILGEGGDDSSGGLSDLGRLLVGEGLYVSAESKCGANFSTRSVATLSASPHRVSRGNNGSP
jgi:hypothetical protein